MSLKDYLEQCQIDMNNLEMDRRGALDFLADCMKEIIDRARQGDAAALKWLEDHNLVKFPKTRGLQTLEQREDPFE